MDQENTTTQKGGCVACNRFSGMCWVHKIVKVAFGLLLVLALLKFVFWGFWGGRHWGHSMGCDTMGWKAGMMMNCMDDKGNCMMMKGGRMMKDDMMSGMMDMNATSWAME